MKYSIDLITSKRPLIGIVSLAIILILQNCSSVKTAAKEDTKEPLISYTINIRPLMLQHCTPCHFPEKGFKKMLDTFEAAKENNQDMLRRIQLPATDDEFMPFKSKRLPLTPEEIDIFKKWVAQGMNE